MTTARICLLWLCLCRTLTGLGQVGMGAQDYLFEHLPPQKGLSQGSGYAIASYDNFMWFGTQDGLNRFDGYTFTVFKAGKPHAIRDNFVQSLLADSKGRLWVGTVRGIDLYNKQQEQFADFNTTFRARHVVNDVAVKRLLEDRQGGIWIMTDERGIYRFDPTSGQIRGFLERTNNLADITMTPDGTVWVIADDELYCYDATQSTLRAVHLKKTLGLSPETIFRAVVGDGAGGVWVGTYENGIYVVQPTGNQHLIRATDVVHYGKGPSDRQLGGNQIVSLFRDKSGRIWVGTRTDGISLYNPRLGTFTHLLSQENRPRSLGANYVLSFFEDDQAIIWVGLSGEGIDKFDPRKAAFHLIQRDSNKPPAATLADNMVFKVLEFEKRLYIGTQSGGMSIYERRGGTTKTYLPEAGNPASILHNQVYDIAADSTRNLWLATGRGLCRYVPDKQMFTSYLQAGQATLLYLYTLAVMHNQREIWTGGQRGLYRFDLAKQRWTTWDALPALKAIAHYVIRLIYEDSEHNVWLGTLGHGLIRYSPRTGKVTVFDQKNGLTCANIRSLKEDGNTLWVGTDCGLFALNRQQQTITAHYTERDGLPNDVIYGILADTSHTLWLSSNKGLTRFLPASKTVKNYSANDGLQSNEFNTNAAFQDAEGTFFFGGVKGITYFKPAELTPNRFVPPVRLTSLKVVDSLYSPNLPAITLTHKQNFIDFTFVAFNFSNAEKNTYRYRLDGINTDWVRAGTRNFATYTNLPGGNYVFRVKGSNDDGLENPQEASVRVVIVPAFYQTLWFRALLALVGAGLLLLGYRNYLSFQTVRAKLETEAARRRQKEAELTTQQAVFQERISQLEVSALRAQMNPHFIFNCLNSIQYFTAQNDAETASDYLTKFSRLIRLVLENSRSERVTLANELETLRLYTEMEAMRFGHKVRHSIIVEPDIDADLIQIPPLLLQPFVENAIWHGLMHKPDGGAVMVTVQQPQDHLLHVEITDNGIGRAAAAAYKSKSATSTKSFGMKVTAERIEMINQLYKTDTSMTIIDLTNATGEAVGTKVIVEIPI